MALEIKEFVGKDNMKNINETSAERTKKGKNAKKSTKKGTKKK